MSRTKGKPIDRSMLSDEFIARFWAKVVKCADCWVWIGSKSNASGYGQIRLVGDRRVLAHRVSVVIARGSIGGDDVIDHLCRNSWCVNPAHLDVTTARNNWLRGMNQSAVSHRTMTCIRGHTLADAYQYGRGRKCRTCSMEWQRAYVRRKKSGASS